jgi:hypothetical protein
MNMVSTATLGQNYLLTRATRFVPSSWTTAANLARDVLSGTQGSGLASSVVTTSLTRARPTGEFTFAHASSLSEPRKVRSQNPSSGLKIRSSVLHQSQVTAGGFPSSNSSVSRPIHGVNSYDPIILSGPGVPDVATNHQPAQYASIPTTVSTSSKPNLVPTLSEAKSKAKAFQDAKVKKNPMENTKTTLNVKRVSKEHSRGDSASSTDPDHSTELAGEIEVKESSSIAAVRRGDAASALMTLTSPLTTANLEVNSHSIKRSSDSLDEDGPPVKRQRQAERSVFDEMSAGMRESLKDEEISALQSELKKAHKKIQDNDDTISECKIKKMMMQKLLEANSGMDSVKIGVAMHYLENDCEPEIAIAKTLGKDRP